MGIKSFLAEKAIEAAMEMGAPDPVEHAVKSIGGAVGLGVVAVGSMIEKRNQKLDAEYIAHRPNNKHVYIQMDVTDGKVKFEVTELDGKILYTASGTLFKHLVGFRVKTAAGKKVGKVEKTLVTVRNPLKHEEKTVDFVITLDDGNKITVKIADWHCDSVIAPYGWEMDYESSDYCVRNGDDVLFCYDSRRYEKYIVDYRNVGIERQAVLITMAVMAKAYWDYLYK